MKPTYQPSRWEAVATALLLLGAQTCAAGTARVAAVPISRAVAIDSLFNSRARPLRCDASVVDHGARGDGRTDDTDAFNNAIWYLPDGGTLCVPPGSYRIDAVRSVHLKSHMMLWMLPGATLRALPTAEPQYALLKIWKQSEVAIYGGVVQGEREEHLGSSGEWGFGIDVRGSRQVTIRDVVVRDCWGDGVLVDGFDPKTVMDPGTDPVYSEDVDIVDVTADGNRRQGVSLVSGRNIALIRPRLLNTHGTGPAAGIDIEPDLSGQVIENIRLIDPVTEDNAGPGILILLDKLTTEAYSTIHIERPTDRGSSHGLYLVAPWQRGQVDIEAPDWRHSKSVPEIRRSCELGLSISGPTGFLIESSRCFSPVPD